MTNTSSHRWLHGATDISSSSPQGGKAPAPRLSIYAATKYGLRGFAACLRQERHDNGVGVSVIFPGSASDVGIWAESGACSVGTVTPTAAAAHVIKAIEQNKAEIDVAPVSVRAGALLAHLAPATFERLTRQSGADHQTAELAAGLRHKR